MIKSFQARKGFIVPLLTEKVYEFTTGFNVLFGQNGCLVEGTMVATPNGPIPIQELKVGDYVFDENGNPIRVLNVIDQGEKEVVELVHRKKVITECTWDHIWLAKEKRTKKFQELRTDQFPKTNAVIKKIKLDVPMGNKEEVNSYVIAALLGDGCSVQRTNQIHISGDDEEIVSHIARILGNKEYRKLHMNNFTWEIISDHFDHYIEWCRGRKAHQKIVDLEEIKTWNKNSLLNFLAGLIDTDGSVFKEDGKPNTLLLNITMQAKSVLEAAQYIIHALFGIELPIYTDTRNTKYVNGDCHVLKCSDHHNTTRILSEIGDRIQVPRKRLSSFSFPNRVKKEKDFISVKYGKTRMAHVWDITVDSPTSLYCLANGLVTHNCGKSSMLNTIKAYCGIQKGGWTQINDPKTHGASQVTHFPFAYTAYTPMPNFVHAIVERDKNPAFYFHGDTKIDLNFFWDTSRQSENGILSGMDNLELAAKKPSSGMLKIELINRIMNMLNNPPNLAVVPEWIHQKNSAMMEVQYIQSLPDAGRITLLFDEPETALSVPKQQQLFDTIEILSKTFQVIIATHSPLILFRNNINLIELTEGYADECRDLYKKAIKKYK